VHSSVIFSDMAVVVLVVEATSRSHIDPLIDNRQVNRQSAVRQWRRGAERRAEAANRREA